MEFIVHPNRVNINGYIYEVLACCKLSDEQAYNIAMQAHRGKKHKKKDKGKLAQIYSQVDERSVRMFGD